jgi:hypothetical protein
MQAVCRHKLALIRNDFKVRCKPYGATTSISTETALVAIGIEVHHLKISLIVFSQEYEPIRTNAKMTVT